MKRSHPVCFATARIPRLTLLLLFLALQISVAASVARSQSMPEWRTPKAKVSVLELAAPRKAQLELNRSRSAFQHGDDLAAMDHVNRALELAPSYANALAWRGVLQSHNKDQLQQACADVETAVRLDPSLALAFSALGSIYNSMGRWEDARTVLARALALEPNQWQAHYEFARADAGQLNFESALRHLDAATSFGGNDAAIAKLKAAIVNSE